METKEITVSWIKGLIRNRDKFSKEFDKTSHRWEESLAYSRLSGYIDSITSLYPDLEDRRIKNNPLLLDKQNYLCDQ